MRTRATPADPILPLNFSSLDGGAASSVLDEAFLGLHVARREPPNHIRMHALARILS